MVGLLRRPNWKLERSLMAGKPVHSSGASTLVSVSSSSTTGRRDTWIQFSHCRYEQKVIVHPDGWFEEGGLVGIREELANQGTTLSPTVGADLEELIRTGTKPTPSRMVFVQKPGKKKARLVVRG